MLENLKWNEIKGDYLSIKQKKTEEYSKLPLNQTAKKIIFNSKMINLLDNVFKVPNPSVINTFI